MRIFVENHSNHTMRRATFILLFIFSALTTISHAQGYRGRDFWICFPANALLEGNKVLHQSVFITAESRTTGMIENSMTGSKTPFSIEAGASTAIELDSELQMVSSGQIEKKSVHITSEKEITVYAASHRPASTDSYAAIPTELLGTEYEVVGYDRLPSSGVGFSTECGIVATEDNTLIAIHLTAGTTNGLPAGRNLSMALNRGQTLQLESSTDASRKNDLTGTIVTSTKPIAFFTGHRCAQVPATMSYCDMLLEMEPPVNKWGTDFILSRFFGKDYYVARVVANQDNTDVTVDGKIVGHLMKGGFYEAKHLFQDAVIHTSKPALVAQYGTSAEADTLKVGDPFMLLAIPSDRFITEVTSTAVTNGGFYHYLNIVVPDTGIGSLRIDGGQPLAAESADVEVTHSKHKIPGTEYTVLTYRVRDGRHLITCGAPIGVYSYGFGVMENNYDSYGHACGQRLGK